MAVNSTRKTQKMKGTKHTSMINTPEMGSALVRIAHKLSSSKSEGQIVKLGDKYYRIKELG